MLGKAVVLIHVKQIIQEGICIIVVVLDALDSVKTPEIRQLRVGRRDEEGLFFAGNGKGQRFHGDVFGADLLRDNVPDNGMGFRVDLENKDPEQGISGKAVNLEPPAAPVAEVVGKA